MRTTVSLLKFVGTVSLGLLTGVSYTTSTQSIPALLALPTAGAGYASFQHHQKATTKHLRALAALSAGSYCLAYALSPRRGRHPYLLWTSLLVLLGNGAAAWLWRREPLPAWIDKDLASSSTLSWSSASRSSRRHHHNAEVEDDYVDATGSPSRSAHWNGEEVRDAMERWRSTELVRGAVAGLGFLMAVVGIWGDSLVAARP